MLQPMGWQALDTTEPLSDNSNGEARLFTGTWKQLSKQLTRALSSVSLCKLHPTPMSVRRRGVCRPRALREQGGPKSMRSGLEPHPPARGRDSPPPGPRPFCFLSAPD